MPALNGYTKIICHLWPHFFIFLLLISKDLYFYQCGVSDVCYQVLSAAFKNDSFSNIQSLLRQHAFVFMTTNSYNSSCLQRLIFRQPMSSNQVLKMPDWSQVGSVQSPSLHHKFHIWKPPMVSQTPLMAAIRTSDFQFVKFLLKNGADVNKTDMSEQVSPLMVAVQAVRLLFSFSNKLIN